MLKARDNIDWLSIRFEWLAFWAEVAAAISYRDALKRRATDRAELTTQVMGNLKLEVSGAHFTAGAKVGIYAGPLVADGCP